MTISAATGEHSRALYGYFTRYMASIPFCFPVSFADWERSMFDDRHDGQPLFRQLHTHLLMDGDAIAGFIQFGLTSFVFDENGGTDDTRSYAVVRGLHYLPDAENPGLLMDEAEAFFAREGMTERHAFFHFFGMRCYAGQGKLHESCFYMEALLGRYGYRKAHENVYYTKHLPECPASRGESEIALASGDDGRRITFLLHGETIGGCELNPAFSRDICFLNLIHVDGRFAGQGLGTRCMRLLFDALRERGFGRLDTDAIDTNLTAQRYYTKNGFVNRGRMRSYFAEGGTEK